VASITIGVILGIVAGFLAYESKGLLIGEGVNPETLASIRAIAGADPSVAEVRKALTMHFGPQEVLLTLGIGFQKELTAAEIAEAIDGLEKKIRDRHPEIKYIFIEAKSLREAANEVEDEV